QTDIYGEIGPRLPGVGDVVRLAGGAVLRDGEGRRILVAARIAEHKISEAITGSLVLDNERAASELVAELVVAVAADVGADAERMGAADPGDIVGPLEGVVVIDVRALRVVAEAAEALDANCRNAPSDGRRIVVTNGG